MATKKQTQPAPPVPAPTLLQRVSITWQGTDQQRERLRKEAFNMGHRRLLRGVSVGEVSPLIAKMVDYVFAHWDDFKNWNP